MTRRTVLIALALAASCKKQPPAGDLPPATEPVAKPAATAAPTNPHAGSEAAPDNPHSFAPAPTAPHTPEALADGRIAMGPFSLVPPTGWTAKPMTSSMRAADYVLPAKAGEDAELIVTYFGQNGAGSIDDNVNRWLGQFTQADGKPSRDVAKIETVKLAGQDATLVSVSGHFATSGMPGASGPVDKDDQSLLAAIVNSPSGPYYFKLVGGKATLAASAAAFRGMLESMKLR